MTVFAGPVFDWRRSGLDWDAPEWERSSPNLIELERHLRTTFGGGNMGIHFDKQTSSGVVSEHSWGAALDHGTDKSMVDWMKGRGIPTGKVLTRAEHFAMVDWVVAHSAELHVQSIVDIGRSWRADRTDNGAGGWIPYDSGYTGHAHFVTTLDGWDDDTPIVDRLTTTTEEPDMRTHAPIRAYDSRPQFQHQVDGKLRAQNKDVPITRLGPWETREIVVGMVSDVFANFTAIGHGAGGYLSVNDPTGRTSVVGYDAADRIESNGVLVAAPGGKITVTACVSGCDFAVDIFASKP